jgi:glycosyltransferase involved in cell wall biosynthesis
MRVVRPGVDAARIPHDQRRALRIGWGVADDATRVVMLLGDPPNRADAAVAGLCVGLAHETGRRLRLLMSPRARGLRSAKQMAARIGRADRLIVDSVADTPWIALAGCDAALMLGGGSGRGAGAAGGWGGLPALWAMAAGVPVIAESAAFLDGVPADDVAENLIIAAGVRATARRLCQWHDEPDSARSTVRRAQRTVAEQYSVQQWAASVKAEYDILVCHSPGSPATAATVPAAGT